jgi:hypothetical protein
MFFSFRLESSGDLVMDGFVVLIWPLPLCVSMEFLLWQSVLSTNLICSAYTVVA